MRIALAALSFSALSLCPVAGLAQEGDAEAGATVFKKCATCHVIDKDQNKVGPSLQGVIGRTAGTHADFKYSQAMTMRARVASSGTTRRWPNISVIPGPRSKAPRWYSPASRRTRRLPM